MVAVCKDETGNLIEFPLLPRKGCDVLCYSPTEGIWERSEVPASLKVAVMKKPAANTKEQKPPEANEEADDENEENEEDEEREEEDEEREDIHEEEEEEEEGGKGRGQ